MDAFFPRRRARVRRFGESLSPFSRGVGGSAAWLGPALGCDFFVTLRLRGFLGGRNAVGFIHRRESVHRPGAPAQTRAGVDAAPSLTANGIQAPSSAVLKNERLRGDHARGLRHVRSELAPN